MRYKQRAWLADPTNKDGDGVMRYRTVARVGEHIIMKIVA